MLEAEGLAPLEPGDLIGKKFRLERLLGRGAAGSVWLATHVALGSPAAIKFLDRTVVIDHDEMERRLDRFRFEAQISARLATATTHTVAVQDAGVHEDIPYLVMEYAPGRNLDDVIAQRGPFDPETMASFLPQIAEALDSAHAFGIIHRDVKLANILALEREGRPTVYKLADFGVAKVSGHKEMDLVGPRKTTAGVIVGTPAYMSPEQIGGLDDVGPSVDLWALGVVLYETLTGELPFKSVSLTQLAMEISGQTPAPPSSVRRDVTRSMDAFFQKALAKRPQDRFASAQEMAIAFRASMVDTSEHPVAHETVIEKKRVAVTPFVVGAAALALVLGIFLLSVRPSKSDATETPTAVTPPKTQSNPNAVDASSTALETDAAMAPTATASPTGNVKKTSHPTASATPSATPSATASATVTAPVAIPATTRPARPFDKSSVQ